MIGLDKYISSLNILNIQKTTYQGPLVLRDLSCKSSRRITRKVTADLQVPRTKTMKKSIFLLFTLIPSTLATQPLELIELIAQKPKTFSMKEAVNLALQKKPSIHAYQYNIKNYKQQQKSSLSTYLPNVTLSESLYNTRNTSQIKSSFGLQASQTILNLSQMDNYKLHGTDVRSAKHQKESHKDVITLATQTTFLSAWLLQQKLPLILLHYNSAKETFAQSKNQYKNNLLDRNDWLKAKSTYASALATVNSYRGEVDEAQKALEYYTGSSLLLVPAKVVPTKVVPAKVEPTVLTWDQHGRTHSGQNYYGEKTKETNLKPFNYYYNLARSNRKDLKIKQVAIESESLTSQYYAKKYIPSISLFGSATKSTLRAGNSSWSKDAGLRLSWNVFDGLSNYFNKSAADARKMKIVLEKQDLTNQVKKEVQTAHTALSTEIKNLIAQKVSYKQSKNEFNLKKQELNIGIISNVDFQTATYTYENAQHTWLNQVASTQLKEYELLYSCGYPDEFAG